MMRRFSSAAASILPGALLILLPKCPLCLAAWLTAVTGLGFSAAGAAWARGIAVVFAVAAVALASKLHGEKCGADDRCMSSARESTPKRFSPECIQRPS